MYVFATQGHEENHGYNVAANREPYRVVSVNTASSNRPSQGYEDYFYKPFDFEEYAREKAYDHDDDDSSPF